MYFSGKHPLTRLDGPVCPHQLSWRTYNCATCGTYDGANIRLYIDGIEDSASPAAYRGNIATNNYKVWIGNNSQLPGREWNGLIDDVRIYSYALSRGEVAVIHAGEWLQASMPKPVWGWAGEIQASGAPDDFSMSFDTLFYPQPLGR